MFFPGDPLNYPANSISSIRRNEENRAPNNFDLKNFNLGDEWLDTSTNDWYKLISKGNGQAIWCNLCTIGALDLLQTDQGPPGVGPDGAGVTSIVGSDGIITSGQDPSDTVTIDMTSPIDVSSGGTGLTTILDHAVVVGDGSNPIVELNLGTDGQILLGANAADPSFGTVTSTDNLLNFNVGPGSLDIVANNAVASALPLTNEGVVRGDGGGQNVQTSSMLISDAGAMTNPLQPAFFARNNANQNNVTGDDTTYTILYQNVTLDQAGDYDGTSEFTAPITGRYSFYGTVQVVNLDATSEGTQFTFVVPIITKAISLIDGNNGRSGGSNTLILNGHFFISMDASDTCRCTVRVRAMGADTVDIVNFSGNSFGGHLEN